MLENRTIEHSEETLREFDRLVLRFKREYSHISPHTRKDNVQIFLESLAEEVGNVALIHNTPHDLFKSSTYLSKHHYWVGPSVCRIGFPMYESDKFGIDLQVPLQVEPSDHVPLGETNLFLDDYIKRFSEKLKRENMYFTGP